MLSIPKTPITTTTTRNPARINESGCRTNIVKDIGCSFSILPSNFKGLLGNEKNVILEVEETIEFQKAEDIFLIASHLLVTENSGHGLRTHGHVLGMLRSSKNGR